MKIAAICGAPNQNTGMMFVDRALYLYLESKELIEHTTFFCFQLEANNKVGFEYSPLTKDVNLNEYDCVIVWGDFIVSNHFLSMTQPKIRNKTVLFDYDLHYKVLLGAFSEIDLKKVIVFGQCLVVDGIEVLEANSYLKLLKRLLNNASLFKVRDPLSVYRAKLFSDVSRDYLGVDAALLNYTLDSNRIDNYRNTISKNKNKTIGLFFARSKNINLKKKILGFYLKFKLKKYQYKWIPWLENKQQSKRFFKFANDCNPITDVEYIFEILECDLIITDTYHLSLMAWSLGIPCICYGKATERFELTVHDKKKEIFFSSNFIDDFYFFTETKKFLSDIKNNSIDKIINKGIHTNVGKLVSENIRNLSLKSILDLDLALKNILKE